VDFGTPPGLVELGVYKKRMPATLEKMEDKTLFPVQKAALKDISE
jgi:hypothetical protein